MANYVRLLQLTYVRILTGSKYEVLRSRAQLVLCKTDVTPNTGKLFHFVAKEFNKRRHLNIDFNTLFCFNLLASRLGLQYGRYILLQPTSVARETVYCAFLSI